MELRHDAPFVQLIKYGMVGVMNTLLTLGVIFVCKSMLGVNVYVSNALGYVVGVINSFLWNKRWVFRSGGKYRRESFLFVLGFLICYGLQLLVVWMLNRSWFGEIELNVSAFVISGYGIATLIGNVVYTLANFIYNRLVTFR